MSKSRYETGGNWYKGNTHIHSTVSDGGKNFAELAEIYSELSYDFLYHADHWAASSTETDTNEYPLLWLDGIEIDGSDSNDSYYHIVCLGKFTGINREMGLDEAIKQTRAQGGLIILAHPFWTGNSIEDAFSWDFDGVEIYNHVTHWLNGKSDSLVFWNMMLGKNPNILGFSVDDAHIRPEHPGYNGGWIMVNCKELNSESITEAIRAGNFYSSCGPEFHEIKCSGNTVTIKTSSIQFARLVGPAYQGFRAGSFEGSLITEAAFEIPDSWEYAYLEIEDKNGKRAWTNPLFVAE